MSAIGVFGSIGDFELFQTTSDTTTTVDGTGATDWRNVDRVLIHGSGVMQVLNFGDARRYRNGKPFIFVNQSPEFVGVYSGTGAQVWERVPPRATCVCVLRSNATAEGVWHVSVDDPAVGNPKYGLSVFVDFTGAYSSSTYYSELGFRGAVSGGALQNIAVSTSGRQGTVQITTGVGAANYALGYLTASSDYTGSGCRAFESSLALSAISAVAEEYIFRFGIGNNITGGAHTEGGYFIYDRLGLGTTLRLRSVKTAGGAGSTNTDTSVTPTYGTTGAEWQKMRGEISSSGARLDGWLDNVLISPAGGQANLPATTTAIKSVNMGVTKSAGVTGRYIKGDYVWVQSYPTVLR